jgi:hypothetical protein
LDASDNKQLFRRSVDVVLGLKAFSDVCAALGALMPSDMALSGGVGGGGGLGAVELLLIMVADALLFFCAVARECEQFRFGVTSHLGVLSMCSWFCHWWEFCTRTHVLGSASC